MTTQETIKHLAEEAEYLIETEAFENLRWAAEEIAYNAVESDDKMDKDNALKKLLSIAKTMAFINKAERELKLILKLEDKI